MNSVAIYDTTLRDGMQGEKVTFTLEEKLAVAERLDTLGISYIEGGFPLANPKEEAFFREVRKLKFRKARLAAFGSTRRPGGKVGEDPHMLALLQAETPVVTIVGKSWTRHVTDVLRTDLDENLRMIEESAALLTQAGREVIYDAEHFFDGYFENPEYALKTLRAARNGGAAVVVLCDTNGGTITGPFLKTLQVVQAQKDLPFGVHLHNDTGMAVAHSVLAVEYGAQQIQGTLNGIGERTGNANLSTIIPNLVFKLGLPVVTEEEAARLTVVSRWVLETANLNPDERQPYVGLSAFAHKAGQHADVIQKNPELMEHLDGEKVGNGRRILLSELAGKSTLVHKLQPFGSFTKESPEINAITRLLKEREALGYEYEAAEGSFELLVLKVLGRYQPLFELLHYVVESFRSGEENVKTMARVRLLCGGRERAGAAVHPGPVAAIDLAFRDAMESQHAFIKEVKLLDYKVRVLAGDAGAKVRVFSQFTDGAETWSTVGVSENIIEASWQAMVDAYEFKHHRLLNGTA